MDYSSPRASLLHAQLYVIRELKILKCNFLRYNNAVWLVRRVYKAYKYEIQLCKRHTDDFITELLKVAKPTFRSGNLQGPVVQN